MGEVEGGRGERWKVGERRQYLILSSQGCTDSEFSRIHLPTNIPEGVDRQDI